MRFLRRASSFFSNLSSSGESVRSKISMLLTAKSLVTIGVFALPFAVILLVFLTIISLFNYKINLMQMVDGTSKSENANTSCTGDECVTIGPNAKGTLTPEQRQKIVSFAYSQIGVSYNYGPGGACGGGSWENDVPNRQLSCNGLVYWAYTNAGVSGVPRGSIDQMTNAPSVTSTGNVDDMTPGDIIVYDNVGRRSGITYNLTGFRHVAIYVGNGELIEGTCPVAKKRAVDGYSYSVTW